MDQGQRILEEMPFTLDVVDAAGMDADALLARVHAHAWAPFLRHGAEPRPLLRACLYVTGATESVFLLALDHLICDGWSYWHLLDELGAALSGELEAAPDAATAATYRDYVSWQREWIHGPKAERQLAYWRKQLEGAPALVELPTPKTTTAPTSTSSKSPASWSTKARS